VQPLPVPCPAHLIPDATGTEAFHSAYRNAMAQQAVFVAIEFEVRQRWSVKADTLTAGSGHVAADDVNEAVRAAIARLVQSHEVDWSAYPGPVYFVMHGVQSEERARELAAALHAALYGDLELLARAVPPTP
jgi:phosphoribosylamine-glycine ligase